MGYYCIECGFGNQQNARLFFDFSQGTILVFIGYPEDLIIFPFFHQDS